MKRLILAIRLVYVAYKEPLVLELLLRSINNVIRLKKATKEDISRNVGNYKAPINYEVSAYDINFRADREALGLTLRDLAKKTNIHHSHICKIENGLVENPSYDTLCKILPCLGYKLSITKEV